MSLEPCASSTRTYKCDFVVDPLLERFERSGRLVNNEREKSISLVIAAVSSTHGKEEIYLFSCSYSL